MSTHVSATQVQPRSSQAVRRDVGRVAAFVGRVFFSVMFVLSSVGHFSKETIGYAASQGVPMANLLVPLSGVLALVGGLSVLLGFHAKVGAWLLVLFLVPVTLWMHPFWAVGDPAMAMMQRVNFMKNLSMCGGALLVTYFGAGPWSLDAARRGRALRSRETT